MAIEIGGKLGITMEMGIRRALGIAMEIGGDLANGLIAMKWK